MDWSINFSPIRSISIRFRFWFNSIRFRFRNRIEFIEIEIKSKSKSKSTILELDFSIWIRFELQGPLGGPAARIEFKCFVSAPFRIQNVQTAEKSRGWLEICRFLDQIDRVGANFENFENERANEQMNELYKNFSIFFRSFSVCFRSFSAGSPNIRLKWSLGISFSTPGVALASAICASGIHAAW